MGQVRDKISPSDHCNESTPGRTDPPLSGAQRVRLHLLDPIEAAGAKRRGRMTISEHEAMKARICDSFSHMPGAVLDGLRDLIIRHMGGKSGVEWPPEIWVRKQGLRLCPKPPRSNPYVLSLMASKMGQDALARGYHAELLRVAHALGPPPTRYDIGQLVRQAQAAAREAALIERQGAEGRALEADLAWLAEYRQAQDLAAQLVQHSSSKGTS